MILRDLFSSEVAVKVFYAYIAVAMGSTGLDVVDKVKPDVIQEKVIAMEKRLERMENLIIDLIKSPKV